MHPEASEPPVDSAAEPSLEESAGDHGDAGPGVRKEGAIASGSQGGEGSCPSHMPIHSAGNNQHPSDIPIYTTTRTASQLAQTCPSTQSQISQLSTYMPTHSLC